MYDNYKFGQELVYYQRIIFTIEEYRDKTYQRQINLVTLSHKNEIIQWDTKFWYTCIHDYVA